MKPDNVTGSPMNPQNWNLYSYVHSNPVNFNDPTGHDGEETEAKLPESGGDPNATSQAQQQIQEEQTGNKDNQEKKEDPPKGANEQKKVDNVSKETQDQVESQLKFGEDKGLNSYSSSKRQYGTKRTVESIQKAGEIYASLGGVIQIGDLSKKGGGYLSRHKTHKKGTSVDIRPGRKDKSEGRVGEYCRSSTYSREETQQIVNIFISDSNVKAIYFNDPLVAGVEPKVGHDNHLHIEFKE